MPGVDAVFQALPEAHLLIGADNRILLVNAAAEQLFRAAALQLVATRLDQILPFGSPAIALVEQARERLGAVHEYDVELGTPRIGFHTVNLTATPLPDQEGVVVLSVVERNIAHLMDRQLVHRGAARSVAGMAAVLAHEIKNPLSGIRGAAQLLEQTSPEVDKPLARLIREEVDRIRSLVDRMEAFSDPRPTEKGGVNIHEVLDHVRALAQSGFGRHIRFVEKYDPSLPLVLGHRDQLVQIFLNLIKNAAEAAPPVAGEIALSTAFRHGVRLALPGQRTRVDLPLEIGVQDNGPGIPADLQGYMFDPFVTTKRGGTGLGLALVAKLVNDHGGVVECDSQPGRTLFRIRLPVAREGEGRGSAP
ncbi:MAG: two-component sensor histidine kinase [Alphaproteobacteria bacterium]|nr:two-component sensor histidine kinase [Alphaproteobacteria bacterium]